MITQDHACDKPKARSLGQPQAGRQLRLRRAIKTCVMLSLSLSRGEVVVDAGCVTVRLLTYRPPTAVAEGVWLHEDRYEAGSYDPVLSRELVERGQARRWYY